MQQKADTASLSVVERARATGIAPIANIVASKTNPRKTFPPGPLKELSESIKALGVLQPIIVRPHPTLPEMLEIVAGERRYRASKMADLVVMPVKVVDVNDLDMLELQAIENLQREDLHPIEEAESYEALLAAHKDEPGYGVDNIAAKLGKSRAYIYARLKLCALGTKSREALYEGTLSASVALYLARIPVPELQDQALEEVLNDEYTDEPMSARAAAEHIQENYMLDLGRASFPIIDAKLLDGVGSCTECPKRTGANPDLFSDVGRADVCTDPKCFANKREAHTRRLISAADADGKTVVTGKEAKKAIPYEHSRPVGYVLPDDTCHEAEGAPTYRKLFGEKMPDTVLIENPHNGDVIHALPADSVKAGLFALGIKATAPLTTNYGEQQKKAEAKAKAERNLRKETLARVHTAVIGQIAIGGTLMLEDLQMVARASMHRLWNDHRPAVCALWGWDPKDVRSWDEKIAAMSPGELGLLLMEIAIAPELAVNTYSTNEPDDLHATAARYGLDPAAIKRELSKTERQKAKAKEGAKPKAKAKAQHDATPTPATEEQAVTPKRSRAKKSSSATIAPDKTEDATCEPSPLAVADATNGTSQPISLPDPAAESAKTTGTDTSQGEEQLDFSAGDRVKVKEDARGPNGKRMKVIGRIGSIIRYAAGVGQIQFDDGSSHMQVPGRCIELLTPAAAATSSAEEAA